MKKQAHPGFKAVARGIAAREHLPIGRANAILASATRRASAGAHERNKYLNRVKGGYGR